MAGALLAFSLVLAALGPLLFPLILAVIIVYLTLPMVELLERRGLPRPTAVLTSYSLIAVLALLAGFYVVPILALQSEQLIANLPQLFNTLEKAVQSFHAHYRGIQFPDTLRAAGDELLASARQAARTLAHQAVQGVMGLLGHAFSMLLAPVLAYYITRDLPYFKQELYASIPVQNRHGVVQFLGELDQALAGFFRGQVIVGLCVGGLIGLGLTLMGLPYAWVIGLLAGVFDLIPYFGPVIGAVPAVAVAATFSPWTVAYAVAVFVVANQVEGSVLSPRIVGRRVGLHPLAVILAVLVGQRFLGLAGMILGVPALATLRIVFRHALRYLASSRSR